MQKLITITEAWANGRKSLAQASSSPDLDARLLLEFALQKEHSYLLAHGDAPLLAEQEIHYCNLIRRAQKKEPIPYLTGSTNFLGLEFQVSPAVLIPRPETEQLVELALAWAQDRGRIDVVDVGTGSGCIAVSLAVHLPAANLTAVDISHEALIIAEKNGRRHTPGRVTFLQGSLLRPLHSPPDLIVANLPYIGELEWTQVDDGVKWYEPTVALKGGADGLELISELLQQATTKLKTPGAIFLEIGWQQGQAAEHLAKKYFPLSEINVVTDYADHERFVTILSN